MAQLKDLIVAGPARIIGTLYAQNASTTVAGLVKLGGGTTNFLRADGTWAAPTNTTYSAGTGLSLSGTTLNHSNSVTAGTAGTSSATSGSTLAVPYVTFDAQGHITAVGTHTHTVTGFLTSSSSLDASKLTGTIPTSVLPSYVDDVLEYASKSNFPATGEAGKIYVALDTNLTWRWSGSTYVEISPSLALGTTATTAAKGNHTHTVTATGNISTVTATTENKTADVTTASGTATYTPGGTVGTPTISLKTAGTTTTVPNVTNAGTVPALESTNKTVVTGTSVANEVLSFTTDNATMVTNWSAGSTPTLGTAITVKNGDAAYQSTQPTFTGTGVRLVTGNIPVPATYTSTFTGTSATTSTPSA